ncbi:MAG TPA: hypothetical protein VFK03_01760 [Candidatus Saccharimonadales bacterium]|nr:hypothetical protein [Candidatus Saccharimonadales bacterium]
MKKPTRLGRRVKYQLFTISLITIVCLTLSYYRMGGGARSWTDAQLTAYELLGIGLILLIGLTTVGRTYYKRDKDKLVDESEKATELNTLGQLQASKTTPITIKLSSDMGELTSLRSQKSLYVEQTRFHKPLQVDDRVELLVGDQVVEQARIELIDGVNKRIKLALLT